MILAVAALVGGLALLVWSADRFVAGAVDVARYFALPPLLIGMVIIGFGTSAPELVVSSIASFKGNPGIALGNAYGSNIANIALILGICAIVTPIAVQSKILRKELPLLSVLTALNLLLVWDHHLSRLDALFLLVLFTLLMAWTIYQGVTADKDSLAVELDESAGQEKPLAKALFILVVGLLLLVMSSRMLVWGAVYLAHFFGVSDMVIGLTVVAIGTSLPELASSLVAVKRGEHELLLGNILGSNLFNTLAVVGIAGALHPIVVEQSVITRDLPMVLFVTLVLFLLGYGFAGRPGRVNRLEGAFLLGTYCLYTAWLLHSFLS